MLNVNFMGKLPNANKVATVLEADAKKFFPNSTPVTTGITEATTKGATEAEIKSFLASREIVPKDVNATLKEVQAKAAAESYARSHGNTVL